MRIRNNLADAIKSILRQGSQLSRLEIVDALMESHDMAPNIPAAEEGMRSFRMRIEAALVGLEKNGEVRVSRNRSTTLYGSSTESIEERYMRGSYHQGQL